jgi:hypothetical protein
MGTLTKVERCESEGKIGVRCVVEYYDGHGPDLTFNTVWQSRPVKIIECNVTEHVYVPSATHMGDCSICGHVSDSPFHMKDPAP